MKYFEIARSNTCVLGRVPKQGKDIFRDNYIHVNSTMGSNQIENIIQTALENKTLLSEHAEQVYERMRFYSINNHPLFFGKALSELDRLSNESVD